MSLKTILVDDEPWCMEQFELECGDIPHLDIVGKFTNAVNALKFAEGNHVDFALLDIEMPGMSGLSLGKKLREFNPEIFVVFLTGYDNYTLEAMHMKADYYLLKPYSLDDIMFVVNRAYKIIAPSIPKRVFVRTFGSFEVFVDGQPVDFQSAKSKELLALLVDRHGGIVSANEMICALWEDSPNDETLHSRLRKVVERLRKSLTAAGIDDMVRSLKSGRAVDRTIFDCDYYRYLDGEEGALDSFNNEYMLNYSWGERTLGRLCDASRKQK